MVCAYAVPSESLLNVTPPVAPPIESVTVLPAC